MKLLAYCRVSTDDQENSLEMQVASIERYCEYHGYELTEVFVDEDVSAYTELGTRPAGRKLLAVLSKMKGEDIGVVSIKVDRMFRNSIDALVTVKTWNDNLIPLYIVSMGGASFNTSTSIGWLFFQTLVNYAEFERNQISERTKAVKQHLKDTRKKYGIAPFGWKHDKEDNMIVDKEKFAVIEHIFAKSEEGMSLREIARSIVPANPIWTPTKLSRILNYEPNQKEIASKKERQKVAVQTRDA